MKKMVAGLLVGTLIAGASVVKAGAPLQLNVGDPAPNVPLQLATGARSSLGALRGRILLVDFFLTT